MANFFTSATTAGGSSEFTLASGDFATVFLTQDDMTAPFPSGARMDIQIKSDDGDWTTIGCITPDKPALAVCSPGTFRLYRQAAATAYGAHKA